MVGRQESLATVVEVLVNVLVNDAISTVSRVHTHSFVIHL